MSTVASGFDTMTSKAMTSPGVAIPSASVEVFSTPRSGSTTRVVTEPVRWGIAVPPASR